MPQIIPGKTPVVTESLGGSSSDAGKAARERAIAKLSPQRQETPVQNPSQVSPEELSALRQTSQQKSQTDINEAPQEVTQSPQVETKKEEPLSSQYAQLARKEKAIRAKVQEIRAKEASFSQKDQELQQLKSENEALKAFRSRVKSEPLAVLGEEGVTYDQLTQAAMNAPSHEQAQLLNTIKQLTQKVEALESETKGTKTKFEETETARRQSAIRQIQMQAKQLVTTDPNYETIKETGQVGEVTKLIEKVFDRDGILLTVEEAADEVEAYLVEEFEKLTKINKLKQRLASSNQSAQKQTQGEQQSSQSMKTLTNAVGATRKLTPRERAILAMEGKLK